MPYSFASSYSNKTKGLLTATKVKVLGSTGDFLWTVNYYDEEGQVVKTYRQHYLSGSVNAANYDEISNTYNFSGELTASTRVHRTTGGSTTSANRYEYDHMGRQLATIQEINGQGETVLSKLDYNEIGQLKTKNQGGLAGSPFLQSTNFGYNERGWMSTSTNSLFSTQLSYQENSSGQYNGNISKQSWGAGSNTSSAGVFSYGYDKLNRLLSAVSTGVVMSEEITYDVMGNISTLKRDAGGANLYHYNGNRLHYAEYFTNGYAYDVNGNATTDGRKGYHIQYNQLNLPSVVSNGINLSFVYDAAGRKLRETSAAGTVNYIDGIQYKPNGTIDFIQTGEGVARSNAGGAYSYEYNLADHLGNNRVTYYRNPSSNQVEVLQRDNYYAFGLRKVALAGNNKYLYNGKELQSELEEYDYGARFYDPVIGRFNTIDPLSEISRRHSPYGYALNNPIRFVDVDGMYPDDPPSWLQKAMNFFGIGTSQPKSTEEAIQKAEGQERLSRVAANNKQVEKNLENLEYIPGLGASMQMSKGIAEKDNTAVAAGAGAALMDAFGGKIASKVTEKVLGPALRKLVGEGLEAAGKEISTLTKSELKAISSFEKQISSHEDKLQKYIADPFKFDNQGILKNAPSDAVRQKIINSRINHLNHEISTFQNNINKIINGN